MPSVNRRTFLCLGACAVFVSSALGQYLIQTTRDDPEWIVAVSTRHLRNELCGEFTCDGWPSAWVHIPVSGPPCVLDDFVAFWKVDPNEYGPPDDCPLIGSLYFYVPFDPWADPDPHWVSTFYVRDGVRFRVLEPQPPPDWGYTVGAVQVGPRFFAFDDYYLDCWEFEPGTIRLPATYFDWGCEYDMFPCSGLGLYTLLFECDWPPPSGSATDRPPTADDRTFVVDPAPGTGMEIYSYGPIEFDIPVTRYAGLTNPDGTLADVGTLLANGLIGEYATLSLMCWDVDSDADPAVEGMPEMDRVFFNGELVSALDSGNSQFLEGADGQWRLNTFRIPIEKVRFPTARGQYGNPPGPQPNQVRIEIDVGNSSPYFKMAVDWTSLEVALMSPVVLIHGLGQNGNFFVRRGFTSSQAGGGIVWFPDIQLTSASYEGCADDINDQLPTIATEHGVDSVHLVCHSKGGLDARAYLANHQASHNSDFRVISLTTLASPHHGSLLADLVVARHAAADDASVHFSGFPAFVDVIAGLIPWDDGYRPLTVFNTWTFNLWNVPKLPHDIVYNAVGGDMDLTGNGRVDLQPDESRDLRAELPPIEAMFNIPVVGPPLVQAGLNAVYRTLRNTASLDISTHDRLGGGSVIDIRSVPAIQPIANDSLVVRASALGTGSDLAAFDGRISASGGSTYFFAGTEGRNHSNIADAGVAERIIPWLRDIECAKGDLRPR